MNKETIYCTKAFEYSLALNFSSFSIRQKYTTTMMIILSVELVKLFDLLLNAFSVQALMEALVSVASLSGFVPQSVPTSPDASLEE